MTTSASRPSSAATIASRWPGRNVVRPSSESSDSGVASPAGRGAGAGREAAGGEAAAPGGEGARAGGPRAARVRDGAGAGDESPSASCAGESKPSCAGSAAGVAHDGGASVAGSRRE